MCTGIDDGYTQGNEPVFTNFDPAKEGSFRQVVIVGGRGSGKSNLLRLYTSCSQNLVPPTNHSRWLRDITEKIATFFSWRFNMKFTIWLDHWISAWLDMLCGLISVITFCTWRPWWDFKFRCWTAKNKLINR